jgi:hypothetical protein
MQLDPSVLTFDIDFVLQKDDHIARIPVNLTTKDALCAIFRQQLSVPAYFTEGNWDQLFDVLRFPNFELSPGASRNGRTILLHQDIPLLKQDRYEAKTYSEIVIESILHLQQQAEAQAGEHHSNEQLIAVFPLQIREEMSALLGEPFRPPVWEIEVGIYMEERPFALYSEHAPEWLLIQQWIDRLDGVTVEYLNLFKAGCCSLYITSIHQRSGYYIAYTTLSHISKEQAQALLDEYDESDFSFL